MVVSAVRHKGQMESGFCLPQLLECTDGNLYVVKFMSNPQGLRILPNEMIAYCLAKLLNLPVMESRVIHVSPKFVQTYLGQSPFKIEPGPHFGSLYCPNASRASKKIIEECVNLSDIPATIVFDYWINNDDRCQNSANYIVDKREEYRIHLIDHGSCFCGAGWTVESLDREFTNIIAYWGEVYERFVPFIDGPAPFEEAIQLLESVSEDQIRQCVSGLPSEWQVSELELEVLVAQLTRRKGEIRKAIEQIRPYFPIWCNQRDNTGF